MPAPGAARRGRAGADEVLTSTRNPRIAAARKLLDPRGRAAAGAFLADGPQALREALAHPGRPVREVFATTAALARHRDLQRLAERSGVPVVGVDDAVLAALSDSTTPQGLVGVVGALDVPLAAALPRGGALVALLAEVRDPGNAGAVVRVADAAGAAGAVLTARSVDVWGPRAVRASAGSVFHLPISSGAVTTDAVGQARAAGYTVLAAEGGAELDLDAAERTGLLARPTAWLFGNEAWGLPAEVAALADERVAVPIYGAAESLNLATAAAVCLYASATAQRRAARG